MKRARWVHPDTHRIFKFMPHNPPERGDIVLVNGPGYDDNGERCRVLRCPVRWEGRKWTMKRGVKVKSLETSYAGLMNEPTEDTPQERDDKADLLARAEARFRWEVRFYFIVFMAYIFLTTD